MTERWRWFVFGLGAGVLLSEIAVVVALHAVGILR
jgi:hypothetical protein